MANDIRDNKGLTTRHACVFFDGTSYEPALPEIDVPGLQPSDSPFWDWNRSRIRQERSDRLSGTDAGLRSRDDLINDSIFQKLDDWIDSTAAFQVDQF